MPAQRLYGSRCIPSPCHADRRLARILDGLDFELNSHSQTRLGAVLHRRCSRNPLLALWFLPIPRFGGSPASVRLSGELEPALFEYAERQRRGRLFLPCLTDGMTYNLSKTVPLREDESLVAARDASLDRSTRTTKHKAICDSPLQVTSVKGGPNRNTLPTAFAGDRVCGVSLPLGDAGLHAMGDRFGRHGKVVPSRYSEPSRHFGHLICGALRKANKYILRAEVDHHNLHGM